MSNFCLVAQYIDHALFIFIRQIIVQEHEKQIKDLHDIMYAMELRFSERETEAKHEFESLVDEIKNKVSSHQGIK